MKKSNIKGILVLAFLMLSVLLVSCKTTIPVKETGDIPIELQSTQELKKFSSAQEIRDFLKNAAVSRGQVELFGGARISRQIASMSEAVGAPSAAKSADSGGAVDYSTTNIQVAGVDEADFVKNDGKYIYTLTQNMLVIVDAFPAGNAKILSETKIDGNTRDLFVNQDRLVVFAEDSD